MSVLVESGERLGLRALGSGGRIAVSSHEQIRRAVRDMLGADHAALFAEPSFRGQTIDWFADVETAGLPVRLEEAGAEAHDAGRGRLELLFGQVAAKAEELRKSKAEADRILGEMIGYALEVPDERRIWLVGDQPVVTFWGHVKDHGRPVENPIRSFLQRRPRAIIEPPSRPPPNPPPVAAGAAPVVQRRPGAPPMLVTALLWCVFCALLASLGIMLLRSCAIGFPASLTGWLSNACPVERDPALVAALDTERARQRLLQVEYERLLRGASLRRQECRLKRDFADLTPPKPPVVPPPKPAPSPPSAPPPPPAIKPSLHLDRKNIEGCYRADYGLRNRMTRRPITISYCFGSGGAGRRIITEGDVRCTGALTWARDGDDLKADFDFARCTDGSGPWQRGHLSCRAGENKEALCTEEYPKAIGGGFKDVKFLGIDGEP